MNKSYLVVVVVVLVSLNLLLLLYCWHCKKDLGQSIAIIDNCDSLVNSSSDSYLKREMICKESENILVSGKILIKDLSGASLKFENVLTDSLLMVFRFSGDNCDICIKTELQRMTPVLKDIPKSRILFLVSDIDIVRLKYLIKEFAIDFAVYNLDKDQLNLPLEQYNYPYSFVISNSVMVSSVNLPDLKQEQISVQYYKYIAGLLSY